MLLALPAPVVANTTADPATGGTAEDPIVTAAEDELADAQRGHDELLARLDTLAESFEQAWANAELLSEELGDADVAVEAAEEAIGEARRARDAQIRAAYKQPGLDLLRTAGALLLSDELGPALHASALMSRVASTRSAELNALRNAGQLVVDNVRSQQEISTGTSAALNDMAELSAVFGEALDEAAERVSQAEEDLAAAEEAAAATSSLTGYQASFGYVPPPVLRQATITGGTQTMTCPLGQPNGFIDSWGFPRSGGRRHQGVDMFAAYGMPIVAVADGYVRRVYNNRLGGLSIDLVDSLGNRYYHAHLSAAFVTDNQSVTVGQLIGANGQSGNAAGTPPHLHWQFHPGDGGPVNPYPLAAALCR